MTSLDRESVARIIDPVAWTAWDWLMREASALQYRDGGRMTERQADNLREDAAGVVKSSLAKADNILALSPPPAESVEQAALALSPEEQHALATKLAANVGYDLTPEPEHPDSPHAAPPTAESGTAAQPFAWMLVNAATGKPASPLAAFVREEAASAAAKRNTNQWRTVVAAPVFLVPTSPAEGVGDLEELADANRSFVEMLHELRREEGDSVTLLCDNPDFNGQPNNAIECNGAWTNWTERRFTGDSLTAAVRAAYDAKRAALSKAAQGSESDS